MGDLKDWWLWGAPLPRRIPKVKGEALQNEILRQMEKRSTIYTDGYPQVGGKWLTYSALTGEGQGAA